MFRRLLLGLGIAAPSTALAKRIETPTKFGIVQNFRKMNLDLCIALGLDPMRVQGVTITLLPQRAALVTVEHILTGEDVEKVSKIVKSYKLGPALEQEA